MGNCVKNNPLRTRADVERGNLVRRNGQAGADGFELAGCARQEAQQQDQ